ncbi:MAG: coproporphyrinogen dehydrogenase HemZ [Clostridia bacterium]|nr:coproporphyrinogen dehydrogenase HemZ [Clostridia bacterium]
MVGVKIIGHDDVYECALIVDLFYDKTAYQVITDSEVTEHFEHIIENEYIEIPTGMRLETRILDDKGHVTYVSQREMTEQFEDVFERRAILKRLNKVTLYEALSSLMPSKSKWGTLVGIRPVKIVHEFLDKGESLDRVRAYLKELMVSEEKIDLVTDIALRERPFVENEAMEGLSLYISIPFCPTRCHYCSFPSNDLTKKGKHIPEYLDHLLYEVEAIVDYLNTKGKYFDCVYIGGGTPSVLTAEQMDHLLKGLRDRIDFSKVIEFTFEAGRPDMVSYDKLEVLKAQGVTRICLNPQTFNDRTLVQVGRAHTADEFCEAFCKAKEFDFESVNFDLILGLADESLEEMKESIDRAILLEPENITVHTLAVKRASQINEFNESHLIGEKNTVEEAIAYMYDEMAVAGYVPYYMYRQKNMVGNLENVGFCKEGKEAVYNIRMMEERHTIVALGAGAVSKIVFPKENRFERHASPKGLEVYLDNHKDYLEKHMIALKSKFGD